MKLKESIFNSVTFIIALLFTNLLFSQETITPKTAFNMLKNGTARFIEGTMVHPNLTSEARLATVEHDQHPSCNCFKN